MLGCISSFEEGMDMTRRGEAAPEHHVHAEELHRQAIVIDAACPLVNPKEIVNFLPALQGGGVTFAFRTVVSIEQALQVLASESAWSSLAHELENILSLAVDVE